MTILNLSVARGSYIPFPVPVPLTGTPPGIFASPQSSICFNSFYLPLVMGALKTLARRETYVGDSAYVDAIVLEASQLLMGSGCPVTPPLEWEFVVVGSSYPTQYLPYSSLFNGTTWTTTSSGYGHSLDIQGRYIDTGEWCGGECRDFGFIDVNADASNFVTVTITDCTDFVQVQTKPTKVTMGDFYSFGVYPSLKRIQCSATSGVWFYAVSRGPVVCSAA